MILRHLLPRATAWTTVSGTQLRQFIDGFSSIETDVKDFFDGVHGDRLPASTRDLDAWDDQFGFQSTGLTEQERRDRLAAAWTTLGGQSPKYIQDTLQANGFPVFVHEWWVPGTEPPLGIVAPATPRNPFTYLQDTTGLVAGAQCGEALAQCGEAFAQCGNTLAQPVGYFLVNKLAGVTYTLPAGPDEWSYFVYFGGETFPDVVTLDASRRDEFENLCLKLCPTQDWLGFRVQYS